MTSFTIRRGGAKLHGFDSGPGDSDVVFQHGLGGSAAQVAENFPDGPAWRRLTLECRAHGPSTAGDERPLSIAMFADDVVAACDERGIGRFVAGGISMGAAIALRLAVTHPHRVRALILARPAWLWEASPPNLRPYIEVADALRAFPPDEAKRRFAASETAAILSRDAPDNLASLLGFFDRPDPRLTAELLDAIAHDGPGLSREDVTGVTVPTLVIGHDEDHAHPLALARRLANAIPGAELLQIPSKASHRAEHVAALRRGVGGFLSAAHTRIGGPQ